MAKQSKNTPSPKKESTTGKDQSKSKNTDLQRSGLKKFWYDRSPVLRFILLFVLLMVLFYSFWMQAFFQENITSAITRLDAKLASLVLNIFGFGTHVDGSNLISDRFSVNVKTGCDGIEGMALLVAGIISYTAAKSHKIKGIIYGVLFLFVVNLIRIIHLWLTGVYMPDYFDFFHETGWQILFIIVSIATWAFWISRIKPDAAVTPTSNIA